MPFFKWVQVGMGKIANRIKRYMGEEAEGYKRILEKHAGGFSTEEARIAHRATREGLTFLVLAILIEILLTIITYNLPRQAFEVSAVTYQLFWGLGLLASLVLVSHYKVRFGGRLMIPIMGLLEFYSPPASSMKPDVYLVMLLMTLLETAAVGAFIDYGASTEPGRSRPRARPFALLIPGVAIPAFFSELEPFKMIVAASGLMCCVWGWLVVPRVANLDRDPELLRMAAMRRYAHFLAARLFAVAAGALPLYLLLASFDIDRRLQWPPSTDRAVISSFAGEERVWFWQQKARLLNMSDFANNTNNIDSPKSFLYGFYRDSLARGELKRIKDARLNVLIDDQDAEAYVKLKNFLQPYRVSDSTTFIDLVSGAGHHLVLLSLEESPMRALGPFRAKRLFNVETLLSDVRPSPAGGEVSRFDAWEALRSFYGSLDEKKPGLAEYTKKEMQREVYHNQVWRYLLALYGSLGFVLIWRRGADYSVAGWLGVWLLGAGLAGAYKYASLFLPAFYFHVWHKALDLPSGQFILALIMLIKAVSWVVVKMFVFFVPCAAVWTYICWHQNTRSDKTDRWALLWLALKIFLVAAVMNALFVSSLLATIILQGKERIDLIGALMVVLVFVAPCLAAGRILQKKNDPQGQSILDWMAAMLFVACQPIVLLGATQWSVVEAERLLLHLNLLVGAMFLIVMLILFLRRQFLYIINAQQLSFVIAVVLIPGILDALEGRLQAVVEIYSQSAFIYTRGTKALSIVLAVFLFSKIKLYLEKGLTYVTAYRFVKIERLVGKVLEDLGDLGQPAALNSIRETFVSCGMAEYAMYTRRDGDEFELVDSSSFDSPPAHLDISADLRRFLGNNLRFVDLHLMKWEWNFFFFQFELEKIQSKTNGGYLLPIALSRGLRGLLVIPYGRKGRHAIGDLFAAEIGNLGLAVVHR